MPYAPDSRAFYDADSHIMELPNFLKDYADPALRDDIYAVSYSASLVTDEEVAEIMGNGGKHSSAHVAEQIAMGDDLIANRKRFRPWARSTRATELLPSICWVLRSSWSLRLIALCSLFTPAQKPTRRCAMARRARTIDIWPISARLMID